MAETFVPIPVEADTETFVPIPVEAEEPTDQTVIGSIARGAGAGVVDIAQGIGELGAAGIDYVTDGDTGRATTDFFEGIKDSLGLRPERTAGRVTEALVNYGSLAVPIAGWVGAAAKGANLARTGAQGARAATAFQRSAQAFGKSGVGRALTGTRAARAGTTALGTGLADVIVAPSSGVTLADSWDAMPEFLRTEDTEGLTGQELSAARLANKFRIGLEGAGFGLALEAVLPVVGAAAKSAAAIPGVPATARALSSGLDALGSKLGDVGFVRKYLTPNGWTPKEIFDATQTATNIAEAEQQIASGLWSKFDTAVKKSIRAQRLTGRGKTALQKAYQDTTDLLTGSLSPQAFKQEYGENALKAAQNMRAAIDDVSVRFQDSVMAAPNLTQTQKDSLLTQFQNNQGTYIRRLYELHLDPNKFVGVDVRQLPQYKGARDQVRQAIQTQNPQLTTGIADQQAEQFIDEVFGQSLIQNGLNPEAHLKQQLQALKQGAREVQGRAPLFRLAEGMLKDRSQILDTAPLMRQMMGEITNPKDLFLRTMDNMASTMASQRLYDDIASSGITPLPRAIQEMNQGGRPFVIDGQTVGDDVASDLVSLNYVKLGEMNPDNPFGGQYGVLSGNYVPTEVYDALTTPIRAHSGMQDALAVALQAKGLSQMTKTVLNPLSQVRNFLSNTFVVGANGNLGRDMPLFESVDTLMSNALDSPEQFKLLRAMAEEGAIGQNIQLNELTRLLKEQTVGGVSASLQKAGDWFRSSKAGAPIRAMETTYRLGDDYWKVFGALAEKAKYSGALRKAGLDLDNLTPGVQQALVNSGLARRTSSIAGSDFSDLFAIDIVRNTMPTYSMVPEAIKQLRRIPVIGNFMSFPAEIIRTSSNIVTRGLRELGFKAGDDLVRQIGEPAARQLQRQINAIGAQRLSSYVAMATVAPAQTVRAAHSALGITPDQEENLEREAPDWTGRKMYISAPDKNGNAEYVDLTYMLPYDFALEPARKALATYQLKSEVSDNEIGNITASLWNGFKRLVEPFASESLAAERIIDVTTRNGRTADGAKIYEEAESTGDKIGRSLMHVSGAFIPGIVDQFVTVKGGQLEPGRVTRATTGEPSAQGDPYSLAEEAGTLLTGVRPLRLNTARSLSYAGSEYAQLRTSATRIFTGVADNNDVTAEEVTDAFVRANEARMRQSRELYAKIQAARDSGMSDLQIRRSFENTGVSRKELNAIMNGRYIPLRPSRNIIREVLREANGGTADVMAENRILQRLPVQDLNQIATEFQKMSLVPDRQEPAQAGFVPQPVEASFVPQPVETAPAPVMASPASPLASPQTPPPSGQSAPETRTNPIVLGYDRATQALAEYLSGRQ